MASIETVNVNNSHWLDFTKLTITLSEISRLDRGILSSLNIQLLGKSSTCRHYPGNYVNPFS